jgi:hypothetical protein
MCPGNALVRAIFLDTATLMEISHMQHELHLRQRIEGAMPTDHTSTYPEYLHFRFFKSIYCDLLQIALLDMLRSSMQADTTIWGALITSHKGLRDPMCRESPAWVSVLYQREASTQAQQRKAKARKSTKNRGNRAQAQGQPT